MSNFGKLWDTLEHIPEVSRKQAKRVVFSVLFGGDLLQVAADEGLQIQQIGTIINETNEFIEELRK